MFGSPQSFTQRPPSRTPSLLSLVRKNEQQPQASSSQLSSPDPSVDSRFAGMGLYSPQMSTSTRSGSFSSISTADSSAGQRPNGLIRHRHRPHIYERAYKSRVIHDKTKLRSDMLLKAYERQKRYGYKSSMADFEGYVAYYNQVKAAVPHDTLNFVSPLALQEDKPIKRALAIARASMQERKPLKFDTAALDDLQKRWKLKDSQLEEDLKPKLPPLPTALPPSDEAAVKRILEKRGPIAKYAREAVEDRDIIRLRPGQWLNDEIINFYGALILGRSEASKENVPKTNGKPVKGPTKARGTPLNAHYFSSFFWSKLTGDGYDKGRLAKWTKKVQLAIDIFSKDVILIPVNHNNAHWTAAAINFRRKRIESYDSMGMAKDVVFTNLRKYIDAEHQNKKKKPFDWTGWVNYAPDELTPQQENGFDCGVFTCSFLEALSRGEEMFRFTQQDMPYLRRRMIWEIAHTTLRED